MDVILVPELKHVVILLVAVDSHKVCGMLLLAFLPCLLPLGLIAIMVFLDIISINQALKLCIYIFYLVTRSSEVLPALVTPGRPPQRPLAHEAGGGLAILAVQVNQPRIRLQSSAPASGVGRGIVSSPGSDRMSLMINLKM